MRIIICGGPRTGKTQLAKHLSLKFGIPTYRCTDPQALGGDALDHTELPERERWSAISADVSEWFDEPGPWIIEGVAAIRALRKWHKNNPEGAPPCDKCLYLSDAKAEQSKGQQTMSKAVHSVLREIMDWVHDVLEDGEPYCVAIDEENPKGDIDD